MILTNITEIFTDVNIGLLIGFIVPLIVYLFLTKYRGIWGSLWILPTVYYGLAFAATFEPVKNAILSNNILFGAVWGFDYLMGAFEEVIHNVIMSLLRLIAPGVELYQDVILGAAWFPFALYFVLCVLFLSIFKKKRKRKKEKRYEDDF